jgi:hypothetical protein
VRDGGGELSGLGETRTQETVCKLSAHLHD